MKNLRNYCIIMCIYLIKDIYNNIILHNKYKIKNLVFIICNSNKKNKRKEATLIIYNFIFL